MSIVTYAPDDLTVAATADTTLAALQQHLAARHQWLPVDPAPGQAAAELTLGEIVNADLSGPRRYGYGTVREHVLSLRAELADGRLIKAGASVVKNAAGYDLCRLFTGAQGELAALREICFKVAPRPEAEQFFAAQFPTPADACKFVDAVDTSCLTPTVLDLHRFNGAKNWTVVVGFAGAREEVAWQRDEAAKFAPLAEADLSYDAQFWAAQKNPVHKISVLPSNLLAALQNLEAQAGTGGPLPLLARAGNGVIYYCGGPTPAPAEMPRTLMQRIKHEFDPHQKFPCRG